MFIFIYCIFLFLIFFYRIWLILIYCKRHLAHFQKFFPQLQAKSPWRRKPKGLDYINVHVLTPDHLSTLELLVLNLHDFLNSELILPAMECDSVLQTLAIFHCDVPHISPPFKIANLNKCITYKKKSKLQVLQ
jgi:hypothetical protein